MFKFTLLVALFSVSLASVLKRQAEDVKVPDVKVPDVKVPDFKVPDIKIPDFKLPDFKLPDFTLPTASQLPAKCPPRPETVADLDIDRVRLGLFCSGDQFNPLERIYMEGGGGGERGLFFKCRP